MLPTAALGTGVVASRLLGKGTRGEEGRREQGFVWALLLPSVARVGRSRRWIVAAGSQWVIHKVAVGITEKGGSLLTGPEWYQQLAVLQEMP